MLSVLCDGCAGAVSVFVCHFLYYCILLLLLLLLLLILTVKLLLLTSNRAFKWASRRVNMTIQPPLLPGRLKEGRYLSPVMGAMDRG